MLFMRSRERVNNLEPTMYSKATDLANYVTQATGTPLGCVKVRMPKADQRALFGQYFGKGLIVIDGETETVSHVIKVAFGADYDITKQVSWRDL